ncbi:hypothetical protein GCM10009609_70390 [Pseudonocardia aurantiaca]
MLLHQAVAETGLLRSERRGHVRPTALGYSKPRPPALGRASLGSGVPLVVVSKVDACLESEVPFFFLDLLRRITKRR